MFKQSLSRLEVACVTHLKFFQKDLLANIGVENWDISADREQQREL
jgi:hypothetical protein